MAYTTTFICQPKYYPLMEQAMEFIFDKDMLKLKCISSTVDFLRGKESGATTPKEEWGRPTRGIIKEMVRQLGLEDAVISWGSHRGGFTKAIGRSFVVSCVEQGIFDLEDGLTPLKAVELCLGHEPQSTSNINYLRIDCKTPTPISGVVLCKVTPEFPIDDVKYGVRIRVCV
jgi:hypothetical protein